MTTTNSNYAYGTTTSDTKVKLYTNYAEENLFIEVPGLEGVTVMNGHSALVPAPYPVPLGAENALELKIFLTTEDGNFYLNSIWIWQFSDSDLNFLWFSLSDPRLGHEVEMEAFPILPGFEWIGLVLVSRDGGLVIIGTLDSLPTK